MNRGAIIVLAVLAVIVAAKLLPQNEVQTTLGDKVTSVSSADQEMNTAIADAKRSLPVFLAHVLDSAGNMTTESFLKVAVPTTKGTHSLEHIWVMPFRRLADGTYSGELNGDPRDIGDLAFGDTIAFSEQQISDWALLMPDGLLYGNYTTRVLLSPRDGIPNGPKFSQNPLPNEWVEQ